MLLKDKTAIITGAGRGIGQGIARRFADEGAQVVLAERDRASGERTQEEIEKAGGAALFVQTDVAQRDAVEHLVAVVSERFGRVDKLINNEGINGFVPQPFCAAYGAPWFTCRDCCCCGVSGIGRIPFR